MNNLKKIRNKNNICAYTDIYFNNLGNENKFKIGVVELHLTNSCDLKCTYCTYRDSNEITREKISLELLDKVILLSPSAIILSGGGEPTVYKNGDYKINDIIIYLKKSLPDVKIGLITNGRRLENYNEGIKHLDWIRISLDYIVKDDFEVVKGGSFEERLESISNYLKINTQDIGIGILVNSQNIGEVVEIGKFLYYYYKPKTDRLNIQFRKTCGIQSCECKSPIYTNSILTNDLSEKWKNSIRMIEKELQELKNENRDCFEFMVNNTNIVELTDSDVYTSTEKLTEKCYSSLIRWIIKANGDVHTCVLSASNSAKSLGNLLSHSMEYIIQNATKAYYKDSQFCYKDFCCGLNSNKLNSIFEANLNIQKLSHMNKSFF